ncbi:hypothetical protein ACLOJK_024066 [Asimina triloba]
MAMASAFLLTLPSFLLLLCIPSTITAACTSQTFSNNRIYALCAELPTLNTSLHWNYSAANSSLSIAFVATPPSTSGWVSWGINPSAKGMLGSQALLAYRHSNGSVTVDTYNISGFENIVPSSIAYDVPYKEAEYSAGVITIFATLSLPSGADTTVNHVWQVGPGMTGTSPKVHAMAPENKNATGSLDFLKGETVGNGTTGGNRNTTSSDSTPSAADVGARFSSPFLITFAALISLLVAVAA